MLNDEKETRKNFQTLHKETSTRDISKFNWNKKIIQTKFFICMVFINIKSKFFYNKSYINIFNEKCLKVFIFQNK